MSGILAMRRCVEEFLLLGCLIYKLSYCLISEESGENINEFSQSLSSNIFKTPSLL